MPLDPDVLAELVIQTVDTALSPVLQRLAAAEARLTGLGDVRDRVIAVETKSAAAPPSPPVDLGPITSRLAETVATLEQRSADLMAVRERLAVVETRAPIAGPAGPAGHDGRDGTDGIGFDDLAVVQQNERSFSIRATKGDRVKELGTFTLPVMIQRGVYLEGKAYEPGDVVTWAGSQWHCNEETSTKPGDGLKAWTLIVKRGRDGKDGRDGIDAVPVVSLKGSR